MFMNTKYWCFQEISFGVFAPNTSKSNIRVSEPIGSNRFSERLPQPQAQHWPCFCLELVACSGGSLTSRFLSLSLSNGGKIIIFTEWLWRHLPPRRFLLVPHHQTSKSVDFPNQATFVAQVGPLAVHCSSWTSIPPCKHAVMTSIQTTVGQRPNLKDILLQVKRSFFGGWGVITEETNFVQQQNVTFWICNFTASLAHLQIQEIVVMSSLTSISSDDDEQIKEETFSRPSQACCFPFTRVASLPESRKYEMRGLKLCFFCNFQVDCFYTAYISPWGATRTALICAWRCLSRPVPK